MLDLLRDLVDCQRPVVVTVGDDHGTNVEMEGCVVRYQYIDADEPSGERWEFGLQANGTYVGGFVVAPSQFRYATFESADGISYFALTARFENLELLVRDQNIHGTESGRNRQP